MKEHPILFNGEEVLATLARRKTQTRRVMKPQPKLTPSGLWTWKGSLFGTIQHESGRQSYFDEWSGHSPFQIGMRLWVRETWRPCYRPGPDNWHVLYKADGARIHREEREANLKYMLNKGGNWRPSIHMPRWASRITLEVLNVRVERVQEISFNDAVAEGWPRCQELFPTMNPQSKAIRWFRNLWDSIYTKRGYGWDANPWVPVVEFTLEGPLK